MRASKYFMLTNLLYVIPSIVVILTSTKEATNNWFFAIFLVGEPVILFCSYLCYRDEGL